MRLLISTGSRPFLPGPEGSPGKTVYLLIDQALTGTIDGVNTVFTTTIPFMHNLVDREMFHVNGIRQKDGVGCDYIASESAPLLGYDTITMAYAPRVGDVLTIDFYAHV